MNTISHCPVCSHSTFKPLHVCIDHTVSKEKFNVVSCAQCGFTFTNPQPADIGKYYQSQDYISHSDTRKGIINKIYHWVRAYSLNKKIKLINTYSPGKGKLLDIGCGTGYFLDKAKSNGWEVYGMEPDPGARKQTQDKIKTKVFDTIDQIQNIHFQCITLWHVLEHVEDPNASLQKISQLLDNQGVLIIAVPNHHSLDAQIYQEHWAAYDVPRHLQHYDPKTFKTLIEKNGLKLIHQQGMPFDAYYISMLSEKYKTGKSNYFKAFLNGYKSNSKAATTGHYSSVIYILTKK